LTARILGSAAGEGFPQWNCRCPTCRLACAGDARVRSRTRASLAVTADGENWLLVTPLPIFPPAAVAGAAPAQWHPRKPDQAVLLTGAEIDQVGTLLRGLADKRLVEL